MINTLVIIDDFSKFTWVIFFSVKDFTCFQLIKFLKRVRNEKSCTVIKVRSYRVTGFTKKVFEVYLSL